METIGQGQKDGKPDIGNQGNKPEATTGPSNKPEATTGPSNKPEATELCAWGPRPCLANKRVS